MTKLYKYRSFGVNSLRELCESEVYYSDPKKFNDPLDCSPTLINDVDVKDIEALCHRMIMEKSDKENADKEIIAYRYHSMEHGHYRADVGEPGNYMTMISEAVKSQLDLIMKSRGVLSLASQWNSPLMWSHYADEHKGVCIEYDISLAVCEKPLKIDYAGGRGISMSTLIDWVFNKSETAKKEIEHKYFYTKASQWEYEEEWRYLAEYQGSSQIPFPISSIYFGMRCDISVISTISKLMNGSASKISFFKIYASENSFELLSRELECYEWSNSPRLSARLAFGKIPNKEV